jgi:hypothetical protein
VRNFDPVFQAAVACPQAPVAIVQKLVTPP